MSEEGLSAAQQRAKKRQDKIKAGATNRLEKVIGTARGHEGSEYLKTDTPFDRPSNASATVSTADPDDIDLSLASTQKPDPSTGFEPPSDSGMPDFMSMLGMAPGDVPEGMADNPLFAMMQNLTGAGGPPMGGAQQAQAQRPKSLSEKLMPLVHLLSSLALVSWAVYNASHLTEWHALPTRRSTLDVVQSFIGLHQQIPLVYAFITVQLVLQTIRLTMNRNTPPPPTLLNQFLPMIPPPFNLYISAGLKYWALAGTVADDLAVLIVGIGLYIAWQSL